MAEKKRTTRTKQAQWLSDMPEYGVWANMKGRCNNPRHKAYRLYGAMGVTVCAAWQESFSAFLRDVGRRPSDKHSIDRWPDPFGSYKPGNVRWATDEEQARNLRTNRHILGSKLCAAEDARAHGLKPTTVHGRLFRGWDEEDVFAKPLRKAGSGPQKRYEYQGRTVSVHKIATELGFDPSTVRRRMKKGETLEQALSRPPEPIMSARAALASGTKN